MASSLLNMIAIVKAAFLLFSLFAGSATARNGCRQCEGIHKIIFNSFVTIKQVTPFVALRLSGCATGDQYTVDGFARKAEDCILNETEAKCMIWYVTVTTWRYCGNGGYVHKIRANTCINSVCAFSDYLNMKCSKSVECKGTCDADECSR